MNKNQFEIFQTFDLSSLVADFAITLLLSGILLLKQSLLAGILLISVGLLIIIYYIVKNKKMFFAKYIVKTKNK